MANEFIIKNGCNPMHYQVTSKALVCLGAGEEHNASRFVSVTDAVNAVEACGNIGAKNLYIKQLESTTPDKRFVIRIGTSSMHYDEEHCVMAALDHGDESLATHFSSLSSACKALSKCCPSGLIGGVYIRSIKKGGQDD